MIPWVLSVQRDPHCLYGFFYDPVHALDLRKVTVLSVKLFMALSNDMAPT